MSEGLGIILINTPMNTACRRTRSWTLHTPQDRSCPKILCSRIFFVSLCLVHLCVSSVSQRLVIFDVWKFFVSGVSLRRTKNCQDISQRLVFLNVKCFSTSDFSTFVVPQRLVFLNVWYFHICCSPTSGASQRVVFLNV